MKRLKYTILAISFVLLIVSYAIGSTYYVDPSGGAGVGTFANPFNTLSQFSAVAVAGDDVYIKSGKTITVTSEWAFPVSGIDENNPSIIGCYWDDGGSPNTACYDNGKDRPIFNGAPTAPAYKDNYIAMDRWAGDTNGQSCVGNDNNWIATKGWCWDEEKLDPDYFTKRRAYYYAGGSIHELEPGGEYVYPIHVTNKHHVYVQDLEFTLLSGLPVVLETCTYSKIQKCYVHDTVSASFVVMNSPNGYNYIDNNETTWVGIRKYFHPSSYTMPSGNTITRSSHCYIRNNYIHYVFGEGIDLGGQNIGTYPIQGYHECTNNIVWDTNSTGIYADRTQHNKIKYNIVGRSYNSPFTGHGGISINYEELANNTFIIDGNEISNNFSMGGYTAGIQFTCDDKDISGVTGNVGYNNVSINNTYNYAGAGVTTSKYADLMLKNNISYCSPGESCSHIGTGIWGFGVTAFTFANNGYSTSVPSIDTSPKSFVIGGNPFDASDNTLTHLTVADVNNIAIYMALNGTYGVNKGITLATEFATDYNGLVRPSGPAWDVGPLELDIDSAILSNIRGIVGANTYYSILPSGTTSVNIYITSSELTTVKYSTVAEVPWASKSAMTGSDGIDHYLTIIGLSDGDTIFRCFSAMDVYENETDEICADFLVEEEIEPPPVDPPDPPVPPPPPPLPPELSIGGSVSTMWIDFMFE